MGAIRDGRGWQRATRAFSLAFSLPVFALWALCLGSTAAAAQAQSGSSQSQSQPPASSQPTQDIPDTPSTVQPPAPKPAFPAGAPPSAERGPGEQDQAGPGSSSNSNSNPAQTDQQKPAPPPMAPVQTVSPGSVPRNQINPKEDLGYTIRVVTNFVQVPVMVKDGDGRRVEGLSPNDFTVNENGREQKLTFFTSDPYPLSVAILLDVGMPDVALQKINQTYGSLVGAFSPYDEVALYTYSSTVSQVSDFTQRPGRLEAVLNQMKLVRGGSSGPPVLGGPMASDATVNGAPAGGPIIAPVNTPPREAHVLNDAILQAALDLGKRGRDRRKVIFVISDGREIGSKASYRDVLRVLETRDIQIKAVVVDTGALPVFKQLAHFRIKDQGYTDILPKYASATGGGQVYGELTRNAIEDAYDSVTSDARNQYTLGYVPLPVAGASAYRSIEVIVHKKGLKVTAKDGYYPIPMGR